MLLRGLEVVGGGAALSGIVLGATTVFIIERKPAHAAAFSLAGAVFTFFGLMHSERVGFGDSPGVAAGYVALAAVCAACATFVPAAAARRVEHVTEGHASEAHAAPVA